MKITHVVENLNRGGLERVVIDLALTQRAAGHDCQIVCLFERGSLADEPAAQGVPVIACDKANAGTFTAMRRLRGAVRVHGSDVLHTHNATAHYHAVAATLGRAPGVIVSTRHGLGDANPASRRERLYRLALRRTDRAVTVSAALRDRFIERWSLAPDRVIAIANGIDTGRFQPADADARASLRSELRLATDTPVIGTVGRLNWAKDQATLLRAFAELRSTHSRAALVLVGGGELESGLRALADALGIADAVHFLGDRSDVSRLLRGFDVFALSSIREGYSIALLEACAAALPIVATDVGGNREIVRENINGHIVPAGDAPALAVALSSLLAAPDSALAMGARGREWVLEKGSLEAMARRYTAVYEQAVARAR